MKPAHKSGTAGQIVNNEELDKMSYKSHPRTLGDVIDNVLLNEQQSKKKLTFNEWFNSTEQEIKWYSCYDEYSGSIYELMEKAWDAAQENV